MTKENEKQKTERRVLVRLESGQEAPLHFATLDRVESCWARVYDLSRQGIGLLLSFTLKPGQSVMVEVPSKGKAPERVLPARVIHCQTMGESWLLGCEFRQALTEAEYQGLL